MTNREASEVLKASSIQQMGFCKIFVNGKLFSVKQALNMAIKALKQEPCEDAISRDCDKCAYYDDGANHEACDECFADEYEHPNFKPKAQHCNDCISRQAVLEVLKKNRYRFNISQEGYCEGKVLWSENHIKDDACKEIKQLPSVTPKEKTGHWIDDEFGSKCSCCGIHTHLDKFDRPMKFKCCSMCGAKMQEAEE